MSSKFFGFVGAFALLGFVMGLGQPSDSAGAKSQIPAGAPSKAKKDQSRTKIPRDAKCVTLREASYRLVRKVDESHYLLIANGSTDAEARVLMESERELSGEDIRFEEGIFLGLNGSLKGGTFKWREGCPQSIKDKEAADADPTLGTWWIMLAPDLSYCSNSLTKRYNVSPSKILSVPGCFLEEKKLDGMLVINCEQTELGMKLSYFRSRSNCQSFVSIVKGN